MNGEQSVTHIADDLHMKASCEALSVGLDSTMFLNRFVPKLSSHCTHHAIEWLPLSDSGANFVLPIDLMLGYKPDLLRWHQREADTHVNYDHVSCCSTSGVIVLCGNKSGMNIQGSLTIWCQGNNKVVPKSVLFGFCEDRQFQLWGKNVTAGQSNFEGLARHLRISCLLV